MSSLTNIRTLGELKQTSYKPKSIKEELRDNLIRDMKKGTETFKGIHGYEDTVIPDIKRAILSRHNIILLGLRGQAKTRIARMMVNLLDEYIPVVKGSEINDDPFRPVSSQAREIVLKHGDDTEIEWVHRESRYAEKLATPDVSVADLVGDVDPIKAAALKLPYSDERVIHFGLIPRSHRSIFVINELPDLQARIQVALFNILQEEDIQIRGFKMKLPLDIQFVFTANPEDYTNRGSIVTPLKDRIDSQILTHYPKSIEVSRIITDQEVNLTREQKSKVKCNDLVAVLLEQIAFEARGSEYIDEKSGVSARLTISAYENLISTAEMRMLLTNSKNEQVRIADLYGTVPSITGKVELVYEGEQEGPYKVAQILIGKAIKTIFTTIFPSPENKKKKSAASADTATYKTVMNWFAEGNKIDILNNLTDFEYRKALDSVPGLKDLVKTYVKGVQPGEEYIFMEFVLHGMSEFSLLSKSKLERGLQFADMLGSMLNIGSDDDFDLDDYTR